MLRIELYSTDHCSLCEQALDLLFSMPEISGQELVVIDVADDAELLERYGAQVPVLRALGQELAAPFSRADILRWLDRLSQQPRKVD